MYVITGSLGRPAKGLKGHPVKILRFNFNFNFIWDFIVRTVPPTPFIPMYVQYVCIYVPPRLVSIHATPYNSPKVPAENRGSSVGETPRRIFNVLVNEYST